MIPQTQAKKIVDRLIIKTQEGKILWEISRNSYELKTIDGVISPVTIMVSESGYPSRASYNIYIEEWLQYPNNDLPIKELYYSIAENIIRRQKEEKDRAISELLCLLQK